MVLQRDNYQIQLIESAICPDKKMRDTIEALYVLNEEAVNQRPAVQDIKEYNRQYYKNNTIKQLGKWLSHQLSNYKEKSKIMANEIIYNTFTQFLQEYEKYFKSNYEIWYENFNNVKGICNAKAEIMNGISQNGVIILNKDDKFFYSLKSIADKKNIKILTFGFSKSDIQIRKSSA